MLPFASLFWTSVVTASSLNNPDLPLVWPYAVGGPLEAMSWRLLAAWQTGSSVAKPYSESKRH